MIIFNFHVFGLFVVNTLSSDQIDAWILNGSCILTGWFWEDGLFNEMIRLLSFTLLCFESVGIADGGLLLQWN